MLVPLSRKKCTSLKQIHRRRDYWNVNPDNLSKHILETRTVYCASSQYAREKLKEKQHTWRHKQVLSVQPCMFFFIQTLLPVLNAGAVSRSSFTCLTPVEQNLDL